jgi:four helix bundle protein
MQNVMKNEEKEKFKKEFRERLISFSVSILHFADRIKKNRTLWPVADQLVRSATSIGANVIEAKGASSLRDYLKFFEIALKSAHETVYWLMVIKQYDKTEKDTDILLKESEELSKILMSGILTMKGKKDINHS